MYRVGKIRILFGGLKPSSAGTEIVAYTFQASDRPTIMISSPCSAYGINVQSEIKLYTDGKLVFAVPSNGNGNFLRFNIAYAVN